MALGNPRVYILQCEWCQKEAQEPAKIHAHCWGLGHFKGADRLTNSPHIEASPRWVLVKESGRILPPELGRLGGWWSLVCFFGSLRTKYPEQFVFSSQMQILYRHLESEDPELRDIYLVYSYTSVSVVNYHCEVLPLSSFFFFFKMLKWWKYTI